MISSMEPLFLMSISKKFLTTSYALLQATPCSPTPGTLSIIIPNSYWNYWCNCQMNSVIIPKPTRTVSFGMCLMSRNFMHDSKGLVGNCLCWCKSATGNQAEALSCPQSPGTILVLCQETYTGFARSWMSFVSITRVRWARSWKSWFFVLLNLWPANYGLTLEPSWCYDHHI